MLGCVADPNPNWNPKESEFFLPDKNPNKNSDSDTDSDLNTIIK
jgi:hypothetical protein